MSDDRTTEIQSPAVKYQPGLAARVIHSYFTTQLLFPPTNSYHSDTRLQWCHHLLVPTASISVCKFAIPRQLCRAGVVWCSAQSGRVSSSNKH